MPHIVAVFATGRRDSASWGIVDTVVLVEGESDRHALLTLAARTGRAIDAASVVAMGGITNLRVHLGAFRDPSVAVLHDEPETPYVARVLADHPRLAVSTHVCVADLEDELVRAVGVPGVLKVLEREGDLTSFRLLQQQPAQRGRDVVAQLRRFLGAHSGHKLRYAGLLTEALDVAPAPLLAALDAAG
jgi:hypothetical protein